MFGVKLLAKLICFYISEQQSLRTRGKKIADCAIIKYRNSRNFQKKLQKLSPKSKKKHPRIILNEKYFQVFETPTKAEFENLS